MPLFASGRRYRLARNLNRSAFGPRGIRTALDRRMGRPHVTADSHVQADSHQQNHQSANAQDEEPPDHPHDKLAYQNLRRLVGVRARSRNPERSRGINAAQKVRARSSHKFVILSEVRRVARDMHYAVEGPRVCPLSSPASGGILFTYAVHREGHVTRRVAEFLLKLHTLSSRPYTLSSRPRMIVHDVNDRRSGGTFCLAIS